MERVENAGGAEATLDDDLLILHGCKDKLDLTQISNSIAQNQRNIVLQIQLNRWAEARALGEEN